MSFERAKRGLKTVGIIWIIIGCLLTIVGILLLIGSRTAAADAATAQDASRFLHGAISNLILGIVGLDAGYYCFKASKDSSKAKTVRNIAVLGLILAVLVFVIGLMKGTLAANNVASIIASTIVNCILLYEAHIVIKGSKAENS